MSNMEEDLSDIEEPIFKYQRLGSSVSDILRSDSASCFAAHEKLLALGTVKGFVHVLDFSGNEIKRFAAHSARVNDISFDKSGEFLATGSDDGLVMALSLYEPVSRVIQYQRIVKSVAIAPDYHPTKNDLVASGGVAGNLVLNEKGWFSHNDAVLHSGEGVIHAVKWRGNLIAWANDVGVKIYDVNSNEKLCYIEKSCVNPISKVNLCWKNDDTLLISWGDVIKVAAIRTTVEHDDMASLTAAVGGSFAASRGKKRSRFVEIVSMFHTDVPVAGLAFYKEDLVLLAVPVLPVEIINSPQVSPRVLANRSVSNINQSDSFDESDFCPELRLVSRSNVDISADALPISGWKYYSPLDYSLCSLVTPNDVLFYIVSPGDIVVAKPRDQDDHISFLLEGERYAEAIAEIEASGDSLIMHKLLEVGEKYLRYLLEHRCFDEAAKICKKLLGTNASLWETWVFMFAKIGQLKSIIPVVPTENPVLSPAVYELILKFYINDECDALLSALKLYAGLFRLEIVTASVIEQWEKTDNRFLLISLASLYEVANQFDKALNVYLRLKERNIFQLILEHDLFDSVRDKVLSLLQCDKNSGLNLLASNVSKIPIKDVVQQLADQPKLQHEYLSFLFQKDSAIASDFHDLQVKLYAEYDPGSLLIFLKQSNFYMLEKALDVCKIKNLYREQIFILGRMGNTSVALSMILEKLSDVKQAIEFISEHDGGDMALWEELRKKCLKSPKMIGALLDAAPNYLDEIQPRKIISSLSEVYVPGINKSLVNLLSTYSLEVSLRSGCNSILKKDCVGLMRKLHKQRICAVKMIPNSTEETNIKVCTKCSLCDVAIDRSGSDLILFFCGHVFHLDCLEQQSVIISRKGDGKQKEFCYLCNRQQQPKLSENSRKTIITTSKNTLSK